MGTDLVTFGQSLWCPLSSGLNLWKWGKGTYKVKCEA